MRRKKKELVDLNYVSKRTGLILLVLFWANSLGYIRGTSQPTLTRYLSENYIYLLGITLTGILCGFAILKIKGLKDYHEEYQKRHLNDERKKQIRYKIYTFIGLTLILMMPLVLAILKSRGLEVLKINNLIQVLMFGTIAIIVPVELIVEKI